MSLDYIYVCCDDDSVFGTELIVGDGWELSLTDHHYDNNELWIRCEPGPNNGANSKPRPLVSPVRIMDKNGLPIKDFNFLGHRTTGIGQRATYAVEFFPNKAFPRSLFAPQQQSKLLKNLTTGTFYGMTKRLANKIAKARGGQS